MSLHAKKLQSEVTRNQTQCYRGGGFQCHAPTSLPPGKRSGTNFKGVGWAEGSVRLRLENLAPTGFEPWTTQPVASRCTDWAIPASQLHSAIYISLFVDSKPKFIWTNTTDLIFGVTYLCSLWLQTFRILTKHKAATGWMVRSLEAGGGESFPKS